MAVLGMDTSGDVVPYLKRFPVDSTLTCTMTHVKGLPSGRYAVRDRFPQIGVHPPVASVIDTVVNLAKRRGLVYPSGEIYGGTKSAWDYGPLGVELKENIKRQWWRSVVTSRDDVVGIDSSIILPREEWVDSGHVEVFHDPLVESLITHKRYRADHLIESSEAKQGHPPPSGLPDIRDPETGEPGQWTEPREFNMMLKTYLGPIETEE